MRRKVTLTDVAARAGVSSTMVSYVLRCGENAKTAPATREKILEAVKTLGYRADYAARALRYGDSRMVGLVLPPLQGYLSELLTALDKSFRKLDYTLVCSFFESGSRLPQTFSAAIERMYCMNASAVITPTYQNVPKSNIPVVIWGNDRPDYDCVFPDKYQFGIDVIERLRALGHRRIAAAGILQDIRYAGMRDALIRYQAFDPLYILKAGAVSHDGEPLMKQLLALPVMPTALVCHSDELAVGIIRAAHRFGVRVPEDLSVVGFDRLAIGSSMVPSLASYDQHFNRMAELLAEVTLNRIRHPELPLQRRSVPTEFVPGESLMSLSGAKLSAPQHVYSIAGKSGSCARFASTVHL